MSEEEFMRYLDMAIRDVYNKMVSADNDNDREIWKMFLRKMCEIKERGFEYALAEGVVPD